VGRLLNIVAAMVLIHLAQTEQMAPKDVQIIMYVMLPQPRALINLIKTQ
jgi:hypothetical protein